MKILWHEYNEKEIKGLKVFLWTFGILEALFILLCIPYWGEKPFLGFGSAGGFILCVVFAIIVGFIVMAGYMGAQRGKQIREIINYHHEKITYEKKKK